MKILLENGTYQLLNFGDIAMLQATIARLRRLQPEAELAAVTFDPERLAQYCPGVRPVLPVGKSQWRPLAAGSPPSAAVNPGLPARMKATARTWARGLLRRGRHLAAVQQGLPRASTSSDYLENLSRADALVVTGGGYLTDAWEPHFLQLLDCLDLAKRHGKQTLLLGHGYGPATKPLLEAAARRVLPHVDAITIREGLYSPRWLRRWGVPPRRFAVTGDDAIALAHARRPARLGPFLGLNIRGTDYSGVQGPVLDMLQDAILPLAHELKTEFLPFPISCIPAHPDLATVARLFAPKPLPNPPGDSLAMSTDDVIRRVGQCRVVITGSYHGGVFALSQGIPAVCLVKSRYYAQKFQGLAGQFGSACQVVALDEGDPSLWLRAAVRKAWSLADEWREELLAAASRQIHQAESAYAAHFGVMNFQRRAA